MTDYHFAVRSYKEGRDDPSSLFDPGTWTSLGMLQLADAWRKLTEYAVSIMSSDIYHKDKQALFENFKFTVFGDFDQYISPVDICSFRAMLLKACRYDLLAQFDIEPQIEIVT